MNMTSAEHAALADRCADALDGHFDQHVWEAMHYHGGASVLARQAEQEEERRKAATRPRRQKDVLGIGAALRNLQRREVAQMRRQK